MAKKAPLAKRAAQKTPAGRALLKRALKDPGLRSKLDISQLRPEQQASRKLTQRLAAPVVPGSTLTEGDLARSSKLQAQVKYAPAEAELGRQTAEAQQQARDVGGFFDQYLARLAQNQTDIGNIQQGVVTGLEGIGKGITGLSASSLQSLQSAADADAAARGTTAGNQTKLASDAAATRQALLGSFQAQQQLVGGTEKAYASGLVNRVGPAQQLAAVAQEQGRVRKLREKGLELATEKGTYTQAQREAGRAEESKAVLAKQIAGVKTGLEGAKLAETVRTHKAGEKLTGAKIAATATQKEADRAAKAAATAAKASEPNKYGVPADQWAKWSTSHRQRVIDAKGGSGGKGQWVSSKDLGKVLTQVNQLKDLAQKAKDGILFKPPPGGQKKPGIKLPRNGPNSAAAKVRQQAGRDLLNPILVTAALDAVYDRHLSPATVRALSKAGYKPADVARTLGVPTAGQQRTDRLARAVRAALMAVAGNTTGAGGAKNVARATRKRKPTQADRLTTLAASLPKAQPRKAQPVRLRPAAQALTPMQDKAARQRARAGRVEVSAQRKRTGGTAPIVVRRREKVAGQERQATRQAAAQQRGLKALEQAGIESGALAASQPRRLKELERSAKETGALAKGEPTKPKREPEKPIQIGGISTHIKPSVVKLVASHTPVIGRAIKTAKMFDATAKQLEAPAEAALQNIDRPANVLRGEMARDIKQHGVKEFLFGAPHRASEKERKDIRETAKRHIQLKQQTSGSDVLKVAGVKNKAVRAVGGFGVDVLSSAATLPIGSVGSTAARAGEKAAGRAIARGGRLSRSSAAAAKGARAGVQAKAAVAGRTATRRELRVAAKQARRTTRTRAQALAERRREEAIAAAKDKGGRGIGLRYAGVEIPGTRAATATVGRGVRKAVNAKPAVTEAERRAARKFAQTERTARGGKEQAAARAQRVARRAVKDLTPDDHQRIIRALADDDIKSLGDPRLIQAAVDLRSAFRHTHKAERQAGVSITRHPEDFLTKGDHKKLQESIGKQMRGAERGAQRAQAAGREHTLEARRAARDRAKIRLRDERRKPVAARRGMAALHTQLDQANAELAAARARTAEQAAAGKAAARHTTTVEYHETRGMAAKNIPQRGRGQGVPITETHKAWLERVAAHADEHDLNLVGRRTQKLLAKAPKPEDVERGYFPREFTGRAERQAGVAEPAAAQGAVRTGTARTATAATGGRARTDPRRFDIVQAERQAAGQEPFSTNVPLVAGSRVRSGGKAVAEADFARRVASHGRTITSDADRTPGKKLYLLGTRGGKYGLHPAENVPRDVQKEWRAYDRGVAPKPKTPRTTTSKGKPRQPGQYVELDEHTVQAMEEANRPMPAIEAKLFDKLTAGWKTLTTYTPRFHMRNNIGDIQRLMEMPGNPLATLSKLPAGVRSARAVRQAERYRQAPGLKGLSDPLNKATIKVAGEDMPVRDFIKMLDEHKLRDVGRAQQERAEAAILRGQGPEEGKLLRGGLGGRFQGGPFGGRIGRTVSIDAPNAIRATAFKAGLDMGMTPAKAADQAHKFFVDYGKLSAKERQILRRVFPFYTWTARSLPVTLANYATHPARYANLNNARNEWNQAVTGMSADELAAQMKPFTRNNLPVIIPIGKGKDGKPRYAAISASWPANLVQYAPSGLGPKAAIGELGQIYKLGTGQLNWMAKLLVEGTSAGVTHGAGINLSTAKSIENPVSPRVKAPSWAADLPEWAKKQLLVDHKKDKVTGKDNVVWRGWASWAQRQANVGLAGQAQQVTDTAKAGRINTTAGKIAEFLGVTVEDLGPDVAKANEQIKKFQRVAELNKQLQQLPEGVGKDHPTPEWRRLRSELLKIEHELKPPKGRQPRAGLSGGGLSGSGLSGSGLGGGGL